MQSSHSYLNMVCCCCLCIGLVPLLLLITAQMAVQAEGRTNPVFLSHNVQGEGDGKIVERFSIGSRPPRCDGMCMSCGRCEAVQVPVAPLHEDVRRFPAWFRSRGDDGGPSNYKPLSWRCKCGSVILNP